MIVSSGVAQDRVILMFSLRQHGRLGSLFPDDTIAPYSQEIGTRSSLAEVDPELDFKLVVRNGKYGFDHSAKLQDEWSLNAV